MSHLNNLSTSPDRKVVILSHSHIVVQHLMKQLETFATPAARRRRRPSWLNELVERAAPLFDPFCELGRVGFASELTDEGWEVRLYLGSHEVVGGRHDGDRREPGFQFNVSGLTDLFSTVNEMTWTVASQGPFGGGSFLMINGFYSGQPVCVKVYSKPPKEAGVGLRRDQQGNWQTP